MANTIIKYAFDRLTGNPVFIDEAINGLACDCKCAKCSGRLEAIQGLSNEWHFRHSNKSNCGGGQETVVHQYAKQVIVDRLQIVIPKYGKINYIEAIAERDLISRRPDVTAIHNEQKIYFEIAVKHFIEPEKKSFFINGQYKSVEIDLSGLPLTSSPAEIENAVLNEIKNKRIIFWEPAPVPVYQANEDKEPWWRHPIAVFGYIVVVIVLLYKGYNWVTKKNRS